MKGFIKDYNEMCVKSQLKWLKKHWKGYTLTCVGASAVGFLGLYVASKIQERNLHKRIYQETRCL